MRHPNPASTRINLFSFPLFISLIISLFSRPPQLVVALPSGPARSGRPQLLLSERLRAGQSHGLHLLQADLQLPGQSLPQVRQDALPSGAHAGRGRAALQRLRSQTGFVQSVSRSHQRSLSGKPSAPLTLVPLSQLVFSSEPWTSYLQTQIKSLCSRELQRGDNSSFITVSAPGLLDKATHPNT